MSIKIVHVSDTHLREFNPEPGDILVHSGDALNYGDLNELNTFCSQLEKVYKNYKHVVFTPGNHDRIFEWNPELAEQLLKEAAPNISLLHNKGEEILGLKFYGTGDQPEFCNWAFNLDPLQLTESYSKIPDDVDILVTHCPPKGILDVVYGRSVGAPQLRDTLPRLTQLKANLFGHIHYSAGLFNNNGVYYSNGAICDESYLPTNKGQIIELSIS